MKLDTMDAMLLNLLQKGFPICPRPYEYLALQLDISEVELMERIERLKRHGMIRRISPTFNSGKLGYVSTLCCMKVPKEEMDSTVKVINSYQEVTHNYLRDHEFNIWFTIIACSQERMIKIIEEIKSLTGQELLMNLPSLRQFKIDVNFSISGV